MKKISSLVMASSLAPGTWNQGGYTKTVICTVLWNDCINRIHTRFNTEVFS